VINRRAFLGSALGVGLTARQAPAQPEAQDTAARPPPEPLVWPVVAPLQGGIRLFSGHTDTVPDIVGRIGTPPSLVIFTEGNHLMALLGDDMIRTGGIALGNLTLEVSRKSGFYPDIVMAGADPLRELRKLGAIEPQARYFSRNRGPALLVRKGNPLGIRVLTDVVRTGARIALPNADEEAARARYRGALDGLIGKSAADAVFALEVSHFPGRLGIVHRDLPEMVSRGYADAAFTQYHLISYWTRIFPGRFELVPIADAERFFVKIALGHVIDPLRPRALRAFDEFFFSRARDVYPRYDFASMNSDEYGAILELD